MVELIERLRAALHDRYDIERQVGEGGMARVFLATDRKHARQVAIKVMRAELAASVGPERFLREIEIAARLQHPHILPVYDSGDADGVLYYVMPYVEGESLRDYVMHSGGMPWPEASRIGREVASALDYAHRQGVAHRDIKPANIMLSQGHAVVADFGIARAMQSPGSHGSTQPGMTLGTPCYMSPEQASADPNMDGRTDIYSLGCVLFELLAGRPPYEGDTPQSIIAKTISAPVPRVRDFNLNVPDRLEAALARALAKDPDDRFATGGEFATAIDVGSVEVKGGYTSRSRRRRWATGAIGLVVAAAVAWLLLKPGEDVATLAQGADIIAVLPFDARGGSVDLLGEGMVNLLSTNLNGVGGIRTVDPRTVLHRWHKRSANGDLDLNSALAVGREVGAASVLLGSVVEAGADVRLSAELYGVDGNGLARTQIDGPADSVLGLVDSLSLRLIREIWRSREPVPSVNVSAITTGSVPAMRAYLRGARYFRLGAFDSSALALEEAVREDSTFATANLLLANAYGWIDGHGTRRSIAANEAALRHADRLPARELLMVAAYKLFTSNRGLEAVDTMRAYVDRYPSDPNGWAVLGDIQFHLQPQLRLEANQRFEPFHQALALDSSFVSMLMHPIEMTLIDGDTVRAHDYLALIEQRSADTRDFPVIEDAVWGDAESSRDAFGRLSLSRPTAFMLASQTALMHGRLDAVDRALSVLDSTARHADLERRRVALTSAAALQLATGRFSAVASTSDEMAAATMRVAGAKTRALPVLAGLADRSFAENALRLLHDSLPPAAASFMEACVSLAAADGVGARTQIANADAVVSPTARTALRFGLEAARGWADVLEGDTTMGVQRMRDALDSLGLWSEVSPAVTVNGFRLPLARFLGANPVTRAEAITLLRFGFDALGGLQFLPLARYELAKVLEADGQFDEAANAYADFVGIWEQADDALQTYVDDARRALVRLERRRG